jgi:hypothetical protein
MCWCTCLHVLVLQVNQEKEVMRENRALRERQYAERRDRDWEDTLRRELELHRCGWGGGREGRGGGLQLHCCGWGGGGRGGA